MAITGKHIVEEIDGIRCTVVEKNISLDRVNFLKKILEINKLEVKIEKCLPVPPKKIAAIESEIVPVAETVADLYKIGITDVTFNIPTAIYSRILRTPDSKKILTREYWEQTGVVKDYYWA